jgi:hypothetical protein
MSELENLRKLIIEAFADVEPPPYWAIVDSKEGSEPQEIEDAFRDKTDWTKLDAEWLDLGPGGAALSFFSDEAFRYYIQAYMIAAAEGKFVRVDPVFALCDGLDNESRDKKVNPRRYGERTWYDNALHRFSMFTPKQCGAILAYLHYEAHRDEIKKRNIDEASANYWSARAR